MWTVDMMRQWILGGRWIEVKKPNKAVLATLDIDNPSGNKEGSADLGPKVEALLITGTTIQTRTDMKGILRHRWHEVPAICEGMEQGVFKSLVNVTLKDDDGLRLIESEHPGLELFEELVKR